MKKYIIFLIALLLPLTASAEYTLGTINVTVGGNPQTAVARLDATNQIALLGNGYNACIPHWSQGPLVIPGSVHIDGTDYTVEVGPVAFRLCSSLTEITIEEGVQKIGDYAFVGCSSVGNFKLPSTLTSIARGAFVNMKSLGLIECHAATAPAWEWNDVFSAKGTIESMKDMAKVRQLFVPEGCVASYNATKFDGTETGTQSPANEKVGWQEAFKRIYELNEDPQTIESLEELEDFRNAVNAGGSYKASSNKSVTLIADIEMPTTNYYWTPIGNEAHPFDGVFNGGGHVIKNLNVNAFANYQGMFGKAEKAIIYNLHLQNPKVLGNDYVGSVLGYASNDTHVTDILVTSDASSGSDYTVRAESGSGGGIVGWAKNATIERCMFLGQVKCRGWAGGIIGNVNMDVTVTDCSASNFIQNFNGNNSWVGGIVGGAGTVTVSHCFARNILSDFNSKETTFGLIVGGTNRTERSSIIENCAYWTRGTNYQYYGLIGTHNYEPTLTNNTAYSEEGNMNQDQTKATLGDDNWFYFTGNFIDYPVPVTLIDMYKRDNVDKMDDNSLVYQPVGSDVFHPTAYEVVSYKGSAATLTIPDTYEDKPVTAILPEAFMGNASLTSVNTGDNVTTIGDRAFYGSAIQSLTLGNNLTTIGESAFEDCDSLTAVDLPDAVTTLGRNAFVGCDNLESFNIGKKFQDHKNNFIAYCPNLTTLTASRGNNNGYLCVDNVLLHNVGSYRSYVIACAPGKSGDYVIPVGSLTNSTVNVFGSSFATCRKLTSVTFPVGKTYSLGVGVFDGADNLRFVDLSQISGTIDDAKYHVNRAFADNPFYGMSRSTIIYLPAGHSAADGEVNAVVGDVAQGLKLTDGWDFNPPVAFTTSEVTFSRELSATSTTFVKVVTDENGDVVYLDETITVYDEDGNPHQQQLPAVESEERYVPQGYPSCLPYDLTLSAENVKVYAPSTIEVVDGETRVTFGEVENKAMTAYAPYFIVVEGEDVVSLDKKDPEGISISQIPANPLVWSLPGFEFKGTTVEIPNATLYDADKPTYIFDGNGSWNKVPSDQPLANVDPFSAYFQATGATDANSLVMWYSGYIDFDPGSGPVNLPIVRTIDNDGTERYFDLNGRIIDENAKGIVIKNGKKYLKK